MVALVENKARACLAPAWLFVFRIASRLDRNSVGARCDDGNSLIKRCLSHDECVIGDNNVGAPCLADGFFDVAFFEMRTCCVNAFAAPVGKRPARIARQALCEPGWKIAADHISVTADAGPSRHKTDGDSIAACRCTDSHFFKIQQAEIIFASFADNCFFALFIRVGVEA